MEATSTRFVEGFLKSWGVIMASEIGDKTFLIAAVMAMKHPRKQVFAGAMSALAIMTVLSAAMGWAAPNLISPVYTHYAATALFFVFGLRLLWDVARGTVEPEGDIGEVEKELEMTLRGGQSAPTEARAKGLAASLASLQAAARRVFPAILLQAFTLTFLAEWGDRSQIATIGLATGSDVVGVTLGGTLGHAMCTGAAVLGGKHLAERVDERAVSAVGGVLFLLFGAHSLWVGAPDV
ncbi:GDT1-like protein 5 [Auxenochlorella protothecoides]|uniref:GDT1 family protein n=1 Tax=Auxenochlorella protothecoides TaxID=3075 RepID=A0A087SHL6_AUXPR|nr:GDT1-like protein 5 [Auxenochlorella protothecoides]KFM25220.1 GDT1-like protein 5 [Auxenochlorella protothecoides]